MIIVDPQETSGAQKCGCGAIEHPPVLFSETYDPKVGTQIFFFENGRILLKNSGQKFS